MKIVVRWRNPWVRVVVYALAIVLLVLVMGGRVQFVYQGY